MEAEKNPAEPRDLQKLIKEKRSEILEIMHRHGAYNVRIFGSVARGEATSDSDVDFLIDVGEKRTPWFPGGLIADLEDLLGCKVDIAQPSTLHWYIRDRILDDEALPLSALEMQKSAPSSDRADRKLSVVNRDDFRILLIYEAIKQIEHFLGGGTASLSEDKKTQYAVMHNIDRVLGLLSRLSEEARSDLSGVNWEAVSRFHDVFQNNRLNVQIENVWPFIRDDVPTLKNAMEQAIENRGIAISERIPSISSAGQNHRPQNPAENRREPQIHR